jgi:hypothetical protein
MESTCKLVIVASVASVESKLEVSPDSVVITPVVIVADVIVAPVAVIVPKAAVFAVKFVDTSCDILPLLAVINPELVILELLIDPTVNLLVIVLLLPDIFDEATKFVRYTLPPTPSPPEMTTAPVTLLVLAVVLLTNICLG